MAQSPEYRRILHRMGYYSYQDGLIFRHLNQEGGWDEHNMKCRSYILRAMEVFKPGKVTILGSGWLLDIPLAEIAEKAEFVTLVDIVHPPEVKEQIAVYPNVKILEADVTGGLIKEVWNKCGSRFFIRKFRTLPEISIPEFEPDEDPGLVVSLNILTQLENLPAEYIKKRSKINENELDSFRSCIQRKHIEFLRKYNSVLITDVQEIFMDNKNEQKVVPTVRTVIPEGNMKEEWTWNFDLRGSDYYNSRSVLKVMATTYGI